MPRPIGAFLEVSDDSVEDIITFRESGKSEEIHHVELLPSQTKILVAADSEIPEV